MLNGMKGHVPQYDSVAIGVFLIVLNNNGAL